MAGYRDDQGGPVSRDHTAIAWAQSDSDSAHPGRSQGACLLGAASSAGVNVISLHRSVSLALWYTCRVCVPGLSMSLCRRLGILWCAQSLILDSFAELRFLLVLRSTRQLTCDLAMTRFCCVHAHTTHATSKHELLRDRQQALWSSPECSLR